jgi:hypothetical protein
MQSAAVRRVLAALFADGIADVKLERRTRAVQVWTLLPPGDWGREWLSAATGDESPPNPQTIIVVVPFRPSADQAGDLKVLLDSRPGRNVLVIRTPEWQLELIRRTSLTIEDDELIKGVFPGARVHSAESEIATAVEEALLAPLWN